MGDAIEEAIELYAQGKAADADELLAFARRMAILAGDEDRVAEIDSVPSQWASLRARAAAAAASRRAEAAEAAVFSRAGAEKAALQFRWPNRLFALALFVIVAWSVASMVLGVVDIARGDVGTRLDPDGGGASYGGAAFGVATLALIAVVAGLKARKLWRRRARKWTRLVILAVALALLVPSIFWPSAWAMAWASVVFVLTVASLALDLAVASRSSR